MLTRTGRHRSIRAGNDAGETKGRLAKAKAAGKYKGRKPTSDAIRQEVIRLAGEGTTKAAIASQLRIGEATMYRILAGSSKPEVLSLKGG